MSGLMWMALAVFAAALVFALVVQGWLTALRKKVPPTVGDGIVNDVAITLVVPARDAAGTIGALLQDLHAQHYPQHLLEVLVVDDASSDATAKIVRGMISGWPALRLLRNDGVGKKDAISHAVQQAANGLIVMTDADARCGPFRLHALVRFLHADPVQLVLMPVVTRGNGTWLGRIQVDEQAALLGAAIGSAEHDNPLLAYGANMAFRKEAFLAVGGFQGDTWAGGDDLFLLRRMQRAGLRTAFLAGTETVVTVEAEKGVRAFWLQRMRWAGKMRGVRGAAAWAGAAALFLPWLLLFSTLRFNLHDAAGQGAIRSALLLAGAWCLWLVPVLSLVQQVKRNLSSPMDLAKRGDSFVTMISLLAFSIYAPMVAVASQFIRPVWKGRRV